MAKGGSKESERKRSAPKRRSVSRDPESGAPQASRPQHPNILAAAAFDGGVLDVEPDSYFGEDAATLGDRLAAARQAAGLTQAGLAAKLGVGVKIVSSWENDRSEPRANRLALLSGLLGVSVSWLLTGGGEGVPPPDAATEFGGRAEARMFLVGVPARDLEAARRFYGDVIGCRFGPSLEDRQTIWLFGHRVDLYREDAAGSAGREAFRGYFGVVLTWSEWRALIERLRAEGASFEEEPAILHVGSPAEEGVFSLRDPSGNLLRFSASDHPEAAAA